jgi:hypothetical protein
MRRAYTFNQGAIVVLVVLALTKTNCSGLSFCEKEEK